MLNRIVLIGRLTKDPELRYTPQGVAVASFTLAVDRPKSRDGEKATDFINIVAWRQSAEFASNYLSKGRLTAVDGRLQIREWTTQDGQRRWSTEVIADSVQGLDRPRDSGGGDFGGGMPADNSGGGDFDGEPYSDPFQDE